MKNGNITVGIISISLIAGAAALAFANPILPLANVMRTNGDGGEEDEEQIITLDKAPEAVRTAILKLVGDAKNVTQVIQEEDEEDSIMYEVEYTNNGVKCSAAISPAGEVVELEQGTAEAMMPAAVMAALKKEYPNATFAEPNKVTRITYEIVVVINGKKHEVEVDPAGNINDESQAEGDDADGAKKDAKEESKKE